MGFIHSNLKVLMAERGLNIQKIKEKTTLSRTTISYLVNNYAEGIQYETLKQLCHVLRCQPGDIFTYYDFEVSFDVMEGKKDWSDYYSTEDVAEESEVIKAELDIQVDTSYNGRADQFNMMVFPTLTLNVKDGEKILENLIMEREIKWNVDEKYPFAVQGYFNDQLEKYIVKNWRSILIGCFNKLKPRGSV